MRDFALPGRSPVVAENGMAATSHPLATATAVSVLRAGGNAVDAAIAASATLCVVEPHMTGIGGDCFAIVAAADGAVHAIDGSGRAPMAASAGELRRRGFARMARTGAESVTVPGALRAWEALASRFGTMEFSRLFADAIRYGEEGYAVHPRVARDWSFQVEALAADEGAARHYLVDGRAPAAFSRHRAPALARTLRAVAAGGARAFYEGPIAAEIASVVKAKGGFLEESDLAAASAEWVEPLSTSYRGHDVLELPPSGQGVTALILLNLFSELGIGRLAAGSTARRHLMIEAGRLAFSVRDHLVADPASMPVDAAWLASPDYARALAAGFDPGRRNPALVLPPLPGADTVYLAVVDRDRRCVSFINSVYSAFGARVVTPVSGVALQNRGACFTLEEGHPNELAPGRKPMHTIIPGMLLCGGRPAGAFGVMGGDYQPMGHAQLLSDMLDCGMDVQEAIDHARLFWNEDGTLAAETGIPGEVREGLRALGHEVRAAAVPHGGAQAVMVDWERGFLVGGSDPRKDGLALGW